MADPTKKLMERLVVHGAALQAFFYRRVNAKDDAADMVQEVYLRMLRVKDSDALRNPESYLFTVASNLVYERSVQNRRRTTMRDYHRSEVESQPVALSMSEELFDTEARVTLLREVLTQLSPKCRATVLMKYQHGLNYEEIAQQVGHWCAGEPERGRLFPDMGAPSGNSGNAAVWAQALYDLSRTGTGPDGLASRDKKGALVGCGSLLVVRTAAPVRLRSQSASWRIGGVVSRYFQSFTTGPAEDPLRYPERSAAK
jgi:RNA polymerase sigma factor (sigma-70 family)